MKTEELDLETALIFAILISVIFAFIIAEFASIYWSNVVLLVIIGFLYAPVHVVVAALSLWTIEFLYWKMLGVLYLNTKPAARRVRRKYALLIGALWPITAPTLIPLCFVGWLLGLLFSAMFSLQSSTCSKQ
jgi:hypothetical protein